jgi:hypothetical protein
MPENGRNAFVINAMPLKYERAGRKIPALCFYIIPNHFFEHIPELIPIISNIKKHINQPKGE